MNFHHFNWKHVNVITITQQYDNFFLMLCILSGKLLLHITKGNTIDHLAHCIPHDFHSVSVVFFLLCSFLILGRLYIQLVAHNIFEIAYHTSFNRSFVFVSVWRIRTYILHIELKCCWCYIYFFQNIWISRMKLSLKLNVNHSGFNSIIKYNCIPFNDTSIENIQRDRHTGWIGEYVIQSFCCCCCCYELNFVIFPFFPF